MGNQATIAVDLAMCARLLAVTLDLLATTLIAGARHATPLLERDGGAWARRRIGGGFGVVLSIVTVVVTVMVTVMVMRRRGFGGPRCRSIGRRL